MVEEFDAIIIRSQTTPHYCLSNYERAKDIIDFLLTVTICCRHRFR